MRRLRTITPALPAEIGKVQGLAYSLWLPAGDRPAAGGVVIIHGAGSCKENHHDFARAAIAAGYGAIGFDQRGHGDSDGPMDGRAIEDIVTVAARLRAAIGDEPPLALRGSSMGGYLALVAAPAAAARAIVAICPASAEGLRRGVERGTLGFAADPSLEHLLATHDLTEAVSSLSIPVLLLHAEGDEQVPVQHSRELAAQLRSPGSRLIAVPGGHHRSIQHDDELQAVSLRFIAGALSDRSH
jgi:alpha-beta hydrolase superfamily lysophospholipase